MPATYDVSSHALLSTAALRLDPDVLDAHARVAELRLGLRGQVLDFFDSDDDEDAANAVALQVNFQVEKGVDAHVYASQSQGARSHTFAENVAVHPDAAAIVTTLLGYYTDDAVEWSDSGQIR